MPIYAYACPDCGHKQDHLMRLGDPAPACPACEAPGYAKQVSAAGFRMAGASSRAMESAGPAAATGGCGSACACHPGPAAIAR